jgi:hypothetical protein
MVDEDDALKGIAKTRMALQEVLRPWMGHRSFSSFLILVVENVEKLQTSHELAWEVLRPPF